MSQRPISNSAYTPPPALIERLARARRPVLLSHVYPDGDAVGSQMGMYHGYRALGAAPRILNAHPAPERYRFLDPAGVVEVVDGELQGTHVRAFAEADLLLILDTSDPSRLGRLQEPVWRAAAARVVVDHHLCKHQDQFDMVWSETGSPSTSNLVQVVLENLGVVITREIADALMVGLATDTGWFRFSNAGPSAFQSAADLVRAGTDPEELYTAVFETSDLRRTRLLGAVLAALESTEQGRVVFGILRRSALEAAGVPYEEIDGFVDLIKGVKGVEIAFLLVELSPGRYKVSLRSKGDADVHPVAERFGGGGHAKAAGCRLEGDEAEVRVRLLAAIQQELRRSR